MSVRTSYGNYIAGDYLEYQKRYAETVRESDRVLIRMVKAEGARADRSLSLLDVGCSSGNLLLHLVHQVPGLHLFGGDVYPPIIEACRANPELSGVGFEVMDLLRLASPRRYDIIILNAVLFLFDRSEFEVIATNLAAATEPGGCLFGFDILNTLDQDLTIFEKSKTHPNGMTLHVRPQRLVDEILRRNAFTDIAITPFEIPIDLPQAPERDDITSHTVRMQSGQRLIFRGGLYTPWVHLSARRAV